MKKQRLREEIERLQAEVNGLNKDILELIKNPLSSESVKIKNRARLLDSISPLVPKAYPEFVKMFGHVRWDDPVFQQNKGLIEGVNTEGRISTATKHQEDPLRNNIHVKTSQGMDTDSDLDKMNTFDWKTC